MAPYEQFGRPVRVGYADEQAFRRWCATRARAALGGQLNLRGLRPLVRAEIKWGLFIHTQRARPHRWDLGWIRSLVVTCRAQDVDSLIGLELGAGGCAEFTGAIAKEILHELRLVYFTPAETRTPGSWRPNTSGCGSPTGPAMSTSPISRSAGCGT